MSLSPNVIAADTIRAAYDLTVEAPYTVELWSYSGNTLKQDQDTVVLTHGWQLGIPGSGQPFDATDPAKQPVVGSLADDFSATRQVLLLNWGDVALAGTPYGAAGRIIPVAEWMADQLKAITGEITVVGHSLGGLLAGEIGKRLSNPADIVALDPAYPATTYDLNRLTFGSDRVSPYQDVSSHALSLVVSDGLSTDLDPQVGIAGDNDYAKTADSSFVVDFPGSTNGITAHGAVQNIYDYLVRYLPPDSLVYANLFGDLETDPLNIKFIPDQYNNAGEPDDFEGDLHEGVFFVEKEYDEWVINSIEGKDRIITFNTSGSKTGINIENLETNSRIAVTLEDEIYFETGLQPLNADLKELKEYEIFIDGAMVTGGLNDEINWNYGTVNNLTVTELGILSLIDRQGSLTKNLTGNFLNQGQVIYTNNVGGSFSGSRPLVIGTETQNAIITNQGLFEIVGRYADLISEGNNDAQVFNNKGIFNRSGSGTTGIHIPFVNTGVVNLLEGKVAFYGQDYVQTAGLTRLFGGDLSFSPDIKFDLQGGVLDGSGQITGLVQNAATINPGLSIGALNIQGDYTQLETGILTIDIGGDASGEYDQLNISGQATFDGTVNLSFLNDFIPEVGDSFEIINYDAYSGSLAFSDLTIDQGLKFVPEFSSEGLVLSVAIENSAPTLEKSVANQSLQVDAAFLLTLDADTFNDINIPDGDTLTYAATLADGSSLPDWLSFDADTLTFSGTPEADDTGTLEIQLTATDQAQASANLTFAINIEPQSTPHNNWNGDDFSDIAWTNTASGRAALWYMENQTRMGGALLEPDYLAPNTPWQLSGIGDFDGDGEDDWFWHQSNNGQTAIWFMEGNQVQRTQKLDVMAGKAWQPKALGDFDGDGRRDDVWWRNRVTGANSVWRLENTQFQGAITPDAITVNPASGWELEGVGDFDHDHQQDDLIWRQYRPGDPTGSRTSLWLMDNADLRAITSFDQDSIYANWKIAGAADFSGDQIANDVLWYNPVAQRTAIWNLDRTTLAGGGITSTGHAANWIPLA